MARNLEIDAILKFIEGGEESDSDISPIIERSQPQELRAKFDRLMKALTKLHPSIAIDVLEQEEMYLALHDLKDAVTSL